MAGAMVHKCSIQPSIIHRGSPGNFDIPTQSPGLFGFESWVLFFLFVFGKGGEEGGGYDVLVYKSIFCQSPSDERGGKDIVLHPHREKWKYGWFKGRGKNKVQKNLLSFFYVLSSLSNVVWSTWSTKKSNNIKQTSSQDKLKKRRKNNQEPRVNPTIISEVISEKYARRQSEPAD